MRRVTQVHRHVLVILALASCATAAQAACEFQPRANPDVYLGSLDALVAQGCFGSANDESPVTKAVTQRVAAIDDNAANSEGLSARAGLLLELLDQIDGSLTGAMLDMDETWRAYASITLSELGSAKREIANNESTIRAVYWHRHEDYGFFEGPVTGQYLIAYGTDIRRACPDAAFDDRCQSTLQSAGTLTRHVALVQKVLNNPVRERLAERHVQIAALDAEWDYYFDEARSQFWWEFLANNALYDPPGDQLAAPPDGQLILLHPRAAAEYVGGGATVQEAYNLVGIVELVGYNRLRWEKEGPYSDWPVGVSLIASYVPAAQGENFGYGLMIHVKNNYSIGATRRDTGAGDETTWLFSVDLNKLFINKSAEARNLFRSIE